MQGVPNFRESVLNQVTFHFGIVFILFRIAKPLFRDDCDTGLVIRPKYCPQLLFHCRTTHILALSLFPGALEKNRVTLMSLAEVGS